MWQDEAYGVRKKSRGRLGVLRRLEKNIAREERENASVENKKKQTQFKIFLGDVWNLDFAIFRNIIFAVKPHFHGV